MNQSNNKTDNKTLSFIKRHKTLCGLLLGFVFLVLVLAIASLCLYRAESDNDVEVELYIQPGQSYLDLCQSLQEKKIADTSKPAFKFFSRVLSLPSHVRPGYYVIEANTSLFKLVRHLRNGEQTPIKIALNNIRTVDVFADKVSKKLALSREDILHAVDSLGYIYDNMLFCNLIPDTYEFYWTCSSSELLEKLFEYADKWWDKREDELEKCGFNRQEVVVLASIVNKETLKADEKPRIAGVYVNRLRRDMLLQADPTVKFACKDFSLRRITGEHTKKDSPFNTYKYHGLPPAPICLPDVSSLEAVLNYEKHSYLFFCAREDFSGYHNFATDIRQHFNNARKYHKTLNRNNIK